MNRDQLVTVMGGAGNLASWVKPLPAALSAPKLAWRLALPTPGSTSWL